MAGKPTYEELEKRVQDLEGELAASKRAGRVSGRRARELAALQALGHAIGASLSLEQTTAAGLQSVMEVVQADLAFLFLFEGERLLLQQVLPSVAWQGAVHEPLLGECICGLAIREGGPVFSLDLHSDPRCTLDECRQMGIRSFAALPLKSGPAIVGVIGLASLVKRDFQDQSRFLETLVQLVAVALANARLGETARLESLERQKVEAVRFRFSAILENTSDLVSTATLDGQLTYLNRAGREMVGWGPKETLDGRVIADLHPAWALGKIESVGLPAAAASGLWEGETAIVLSDGTEAPVSQVILAHRAPDGALEYYSTIMRDISGSKRLEEQLRNNESFILNVLDSVQDGISILDPDLTIRRVNQTMRNWYAANLPLEGLKCYQAYHNAATPCDPCPTLRCMKSGQMAVDVVPGLPGSPVQWLELFTFPIKTPGTQKTVGAVEFVRDISYRKRAEEALRESEERFRQIAENIKEVFWLFDWQQQRALYVSPAYEQVWGRTREALYGRYGEWAESIHPEDRFHAQQTFNRILETGGGEAREYRIVRADGAERWISDVGYAIRDRDGQILRITGIAEDITDRKEAQTRLAHSHDLMRYVIEHTNSAVAVHDRDLRYIYVSQRYLDQFRVKEMDIIGKHHYDVFPDLPQKWRDVHQRALQGQVASADRDPYYRADGTVDWTRWECRPWYEPAGGIGGIIIYTEVITERLNEEEALQQANLVVENSPVVLFRWQAAPGWPVVMVSQNVIQFGYTPQELLSGAVLYSSMVHPEDLDRVAREVREYAASGVSRFQQDYRIVTKSGEVRWVDDRTVVERNADGQVGSFQGVVLDISERKRAEEALQRSHQTFLAVLDGIDATVYAADMSSHEILFMNKHMIDDFGGDFTGRPCYEAFRGYRSPCDHCTNDQLLDADGQPQGVCVWEMKNPVTGKWYINRDRAIRWLDGRIVRLQIATDISMLKKMELEHNRVEEQLRQAQKMESVGRLAGGVAHDFNNMLQAILGHMDLALTQVDPDQPIFADLQQIKRAAERSADLVRQLLAFARKQTISPKVLDLNDTVDGTLKMLRRLIGEDIDLVWLPGHGLWQVKVDPGQIDQILANLAVNARDAIAGVGKITIETDNVTLDEVYCGEHVGFKAGKYVLLAVSDDGMGMDQTVLEHLFEPFFTTKAVGKGTGLGLATVYGIVKQNEGFINVYSEPSRGTTIKIYLPAHRTKEERAHLKKGGEPMAGGRENILLVEDEPTILDLTTAMLERLGYTVVGAKAPGEAIRLAREHAGEIQLLITDVIMPEMNGRDLAKNVISLYPDIKRLFMSGYTANIIAHHGVLDEGVHFIQKPFSMKDLAEKVREALGLEDAAPV